MENYFKFYIPNDSKSAVIGLSGSKIKDIQLHAKARIKLSDLESPLTQVEVWSHEKQAGVNTPA